MEFYDRKEELKLLEMLYRNRPSFCVLTGKRRVGKTELIKEFARRKKALYLFVDSNKSRDILLSEYEELVKEELDQPKYIRFKSFGELLNFLLDYKDDIVVAFDEFQRFLRIDPSAITELQNQWDLKLKKSKVLLITSGSSIGMMKKIFIEERAPLFKRADSIINLRPFSMKEIFEVMDSLGIKGIQEKLDTYCLFGGTIYYYRLMEKYEVRSFKDALGKLVLSDLAPLKNEVRDILIEEFGKEHATYYEILSAMAAGKATKKEIGDVTHISPSSLSPYLYDLIHLLQIADYIIPVTEIQGKTKKGRYILRDNFFRFYFRFIYKEMSHYLIGNYGPINERIVTEWPDFRGRVFEDTAVESLKRSLSVKFREVGRFWDRKGNEIDLLALNRKEKGVLMVEIKSKKLSMAAAGRIIENLKKKTDLIPFKPRIIRYGVVALDVEGRETLKREGYFTWTLKDFLK